MIGQIKIVYINWTLDIIQISIYGKNQKNQKNRFKSKKSDLNQKNPIFSIFCQKIMIFCIPDVHETNKVLIPA